MNRDVSFRELIDAVNRGKTELWRRLYEVPVPPEVVEGLRPRYEPHGLPPEYWFGTLAYRFTRLDPYTQYELLKSFEDYELFCEEVATPPEIPPWLGRELGRLAEEYMLSRYGYYGEARGVVESTGVAAPPQSLDQLEEAMRRMLPLSPDFLHDMREFLVAFFGETHYETARPGGLVKLGFYAYRNVERFAGGEISDWELLDWLGSILIKSPGGPMCRQAVYVWPWLKRWFLETFINLRCDDYKNSIVGTIAEDAAAALMNIEFLTAFSAWEIQQDCISVEKGFSPTAGIFTSPLDGFSEQCAFLGLVHPETRFMELLEECTKPVVDRCDIIAVEYGKRYGLTPRMIETLRGDCRKVLSTLFREPRLLKMFVAYWIYGPIGVWPRLAGEFYRALEEATLIPRWRRWRVFRALREAGEIR